MTISATNFTLVNGTNTFTAIAQDSLGNVSTNVSAANLLATNNYAYDLNGNLRTNGTQVLDYDDENQLIRVTVTNSWKDEFVYDGKLRRRIERDYQWDAGTSGWTETNETHFIYDGNVVIEERNSNNVPLATYTRGNDLSGTLQGAGGIGGLLARSDHSQPPSPYYSAHSYYHADGNGNVTMLINASQLMVAKYLYDPYGNTLSMSGSMAALNNYRFSSKEWNNNAGYYYYGRRFYDPNLQRWVNRDPLGEAGGINLYGPVANNPVNAIDIFGFRTCYPVLVVTLYGKQYLPETTVKNSDQASLIPGSVIGLTQIYIAVPDGLDPQSVVNKFKNRNWLSPAGVLYFDDFWSNPNNDYKKLSPIYDAFGNCEYGATGAESGFPLAILQVAGELKHPGWKNNPINKADIASGYRAISNGGSLSTKMANLIPSVP